MQDLNTASPPHASVLLDLAIRILRDKNRNRLPLFENENPTPAVDVSYTIDCTRQEYIDHQEHTLGGAVIPWTSLMNRRMGDVIPDLAEMFVRGMWTASAHRVPQLLQYELCGRQSTAMIIVVRQTASILVHRLKHHGRP